MKEQVYTVLQNLSGSEFVVEDANLQTDLGLDSFDMVTLLLELEETFGIRLDETDMNPFDLVTVRDVDALVSKYMGDTHEKEG